MGQPMLGSGLVQLALPKTIGASFFLPHIHNPLNTVHGSLFGCSIKDVQSVKVSVELGFDAAFRSLLIGLDQLETLAEQGLEHLKQ